jgi:poly(glycerol-phosphate) alpha-glucosyltransferase
MSRASGGLFESVRLLAQTLCAHHQLDLEVLSMEDEHSVADLHAWKPVTPSIYPVIGPRAFGYSWALSHAMRHLQSDLVHSQGLWMYPSRASLAWARSTRKPYLVSPRGMLSSWALENVAWKKKLSGLLFENAHLQGAACLHALAASELTSIREYGLRNPVCVIPNGVDLPPSDQPRTSWTGIVPAGAKVLLFLGRLHPKKGLVNLLHAWRLARSIGESRCADWHLVIAGWNQGGHEDVLRKLCRTMDIQNTVHFVGPKFGVEKEHAYLTADGFILPSFSEGLPMTVLEAWSYGLPVLMTPQCNLPEGFQANAALFIEPDAQSIAHGLEQLWAMSDADRRLLGARGRHLVEQKFSWKTIADDMYRVYEWVLGGGPVPSCVVTD